MKLDKKMALKLLCYFGGLIVMTFGVIISVKSDLGVTPISSIPYTMTVVSGMDLGIATMLFSEVYYHADQHCFCRVGRISVCVPRFCSLSTGGIYYCRIQSHKEKLFHRQGDI